MEIGLKRFFLWFVGGAVVIVAAVMVAVDIVDPVFINDSTPQPLREARWRGSRIARAIDAVELRDSVSAALRAHPAPNGLSIVLPNSVAAGRRESIAAGLREAWHRQAGDAAQYPVVILVRANKAGRKIAGFEYVPTELVLLEQDAGGNACVIELSTASAAAFSREEPDSTRSQWAPGFGACGSFALHGPPGPGISRWLRSESWRPVTFYSSAEAAAIMKDPKQPRSTGGFAMANGFRVPSWFGDGDTERSIAPDGAGCLAERREACLRLLTPGVMVDEWTHSSLVPRSIVQSRNSVGSGGWRRGLVTEIERGLGPEKFAQFWKSTTGPEETLSGLYPGGAAGLIHDRLAVAAHPLTNNPWPTPVEWILHLAIVGTAVGIGALAARSRTMTV
jgi:hypothetical protein